MHLLKDLPAWSYSLEAFDFSRNIKLFACWKVRIATTTQLYSILLFVDIAAVELSGIAALSTHRRSSPFTRITHPQTHTHTHAPNFVQDTSRCRLYKNDCCVPNELYTITVCHYTSTSCKSGSYCLPATLGYKHGLVATSSVQNHFHHSQHIRNKLYTRASCES